MLLPPPVPRQNRGRRAAAVSVALITTVAAAAIGIGGCDDGATGGSSSHADAEPPPTPEVRFERFMADFRRRINDPYDSNTHSSDGATYTGDYKVVGAELIPPETDDGIYRAKVSIGVESSFTLLPPEESTESSGDEPKRDPLLAPDEPVRSLIPDEILNSDYGTGKGRSLPSSNVHTLDHDEVQHYEFAFIDGRWRAKFELELDTYLGKAFEVALKRQ